MRHRLQITVEGIYLKNKIQHPRTAYYYPVCHGTGTNGRWIPQGRQGKFRKMCQGCHGEEGISTTHNFPNLAGQFQKYIERQIQSFQDGKRVDPTMSGMAASITEIQYPKDIAAYFSSKKRMAGTPSKNKDLAAKGKVLPRGKPGNRGICLQQLSWRKWLWERCPK